MTIKLRTYAELKHEYKMEYFLNVDLEPGIHVVKNIHRKSLSGSLPFYTHTRGFNIKRGPGG